MSAPKLSALSPRPTLPNPAHTPGLAITLHAKPSADYAAKRARTEALLREAAQRYAPLTQACSLGAEDMVIAHLIATLALPIPIFVLDTGALHAETLALLAQLRAQHEPHNTVTVYRPEPAAVESYVQRHGEGAMRQSLDLRKACCQIRKLEPLSRALAGQRAWVTGLRREQSEHRAEGQAIELPAAGASGSAALVKINPLIDWSWGDVWHTIEREGIAYNPLHDQFYPSIGCAPCTRAISLGEDFRAGRWWWELESQKECGLHVHGNATARPQAAATPHPTEPQR